MQGADAGALMRSFDAVRREQEVMAAEAYNNDGTFKERLNQVARGRARALGTLESLLPTMRGRSSPWAGQSLWYAVFKGLRSLAHSTQ